VPYPSYSEVPAPPARCSHRGLALLLFYERRRLLFANAARLPDQRCRQHANPSPTIPWDSPSSDSCERRHSQHGLVHRGSRALGLAHRRGGERGRRRSTLRGRRASYRFASRSVTSDALAEFSVVAMAVDNSGTLSRWNAWLEGGTEIQPPSSTRRTHTKWTGQFS
jgi:hypothetical protein